MHPAPSVIIFTSLTGLGFGLLVFLGLGLPDTSGVVAFVFFAISYLLAIGGLISSTFHLGRPERAIKAFSQWRSSWLSREAWLAVASLFVMAVYGAGLVFLDTRWGILGAIGSALSLATVFSTAMIYAQLKTVPRWNTALTPLLFITLALTGGAILSGSVDTALLLLISAGIVQIVYWINGDQALARSGTDMASATGLGAMGTVKAFEPPHTGTNYLLREFVHIVGRKHAAKLRVIALILMIGTPTLFLSLPFNHWLALGAVATHIAGVFTSRWLFFAQAEHVVGLYYGKR
ncbi:MAG: dimethyl sulfoxide reductase anchor subunit [Rhodobacteraceae bacterium]|nr:dimethyl sulfoxide reductase anchor subunit [Paracoccaceae bacterium]MBL6640060.1 dimethyl sulfoxide reductase anchor subunit [Paracoccaceae bacterium]MBL6676951.1 dimethyl sulfoxide reductase anchor subunit [Paracoccaceae bacterium]MBL6789092.1 dimethyl sulfoxide reductase anchor subunit [Paracoccaceae bacterium]MBL6859881.1 dimethyl sulfoxide reductase anchor subunit [Paracoccaceae bacterium]